MKTFLISLLATLSVAVLSSCFRLNRFELGTLDLGFTWDDLTTDLCC